MHLREGLLLGFCVMIAKELKLDGNQRPKYPRLFKISRLQNPGLSRAFFVSYDEARIKGSHLGHSFDILRSSVLKLNKDL